MPGWAHFSRGSVLGVMDYSVHGSKSCLNDVESKNQVEKFIQFTIGRSGIHTDTHKTREKPHKTHNVEDK